MNLSPSAWPGRWERILRPSFQGKVNPKRNKRGSNDGEECKGDPDAPVSGRMLRKTHPARAPRPLRMRLAVVSLCFWVVGCLLVFAPSFCSADFLQSTRRQQTLWHHEFADDSDPGDFGIDHDQAKHKLAQSLGLVSPEEELYVGGERVGYSSSGSYPDILEKLDRITRHEDDGKEWLNITLDPMDASNADAVPASAWTPQEHQGHSPRFRSRLQDEPLGVTSALQVSARANGVVAGTNTAADEKTAGSTPGEESQREAAEVEKYSTTQTKRQSEADLARIQGPHMLVKAVRDFQVVEEENSLDTDTLITVFYNFPLQTMESKQIAFIVMALPPGYVARKDGSGCDSVDPEMPALKCSKRNAYVRNRPGSLSTFVTIASADSSISLPLGRHSFRLAVRTPTEALSIENPANWWFATFRFTGGHAITKHWENRKLISKRDCIWGEWRQETPCSTTCGGGYEVWTRSLYSGESEKACGGAFMKRKCQVEECSLNCQLDEWLTMADCTKSCEATDHDAFKIRMRKVLVHKKGWGQACAEMHPWDHQLGVGWSEKMQAVVSISPCDRKFKEPCPAMLGCRVEESNTRTIPDVFPWGACPFPCGGFGSITSIVQVANGIPRWIGEKHFPGSFQIPCRADTEPLVTTRKCNIDACEDCSVYIENPIFGRATRAWFFFLPTAEADIAEVTAPRGVTIVEFPPKGGQDQPPRFKVSSLSDTLPPAVRSARDTPQLAPPTAADVLSDAEQLGTCSTMATSFGEIRSCRVFPSKHYAGSQAAELMFAAIIEPSITEEKGTSRKRSHNGNRPQWFALPVLLGKREEMEDAGNFYLWLTRSKYPNDPEVFKCHLRTNLPLPHRCKFSYRPKNPQDCKKCKPGVDLQIETFRKFVPSVHGGTCDVPHALQASGETLVKTHCVKSCSQLRQKELEGATGPTAKEKQTGISRRRTGEATTLERISRSAMQMFLIGKAAIKAAAMKGDKYALNDPDFLYGASRHAVDDSSMPTIGEESLFLPQEASEKAAALKEPEAAQAAPQRAPEAAGEGKPTEGEAAAPASAEAPTAAPTPETTEPSTATSSPTPPETIETPAATATSTAAITRPPEEGEEAGSETEGASMKQEEGEAQASSEKAPSEAAAAEGKAAQAKPPAGAAGAAGEGAATGKPAAEEPKEEEGEASQKEGAASEQEEQASVEEQEKAPESAKGGAAEKEAGSSEEGENKPAGGAESESKEEGGSETNQEDEGSVKGTAKGRETEIEGESGKEAETESAQSANQKGETTSQAQSEGESAAESGKGGEPESSQSENEKGETKSQAQPEGEGNKTETEAESAAEGSSAKGKDGGINENEEEENVE